MTLWLFLVNDNWIVFTLWPPQTIFLCQTPAALHSISPSLWWMATSSVYSADSLAGQRWISRVLTHWSAAGSWPANWSILWTLVCFVVPHIAFPCTLFRIFIIPQAFFVFCQFLACWPLLQANPCMCCASAIFKAKPQLMFYWTSFWACVSSRDLPIPNFFCIDRSPNLVDAPDSNAQICMKCHSKNLSRYRIPGRKDPSYFCQFWRVSFYGWLWLRRIVCWHNFSRKSGLYCSRSLRSVFGIWESLKVFQLSSTVQYPQVFCVSQLEGLFLRRCWLAVSSQPDEFLLKSFEV